MARHVRRAAGAWVGPVVLAATIGGSPGPAAAQPPLSRFVDPVHGLDVEALVARGLEHSPALEASHAEADAAAAMARQARLRANPMAEVVRREEIGGMDNQTEIGVAWPLELGRRRPRVAAADAAARAAALVHADRRRLRADAIRRAYGELAAAARDLRVTLDLLASERQLFELVDARAREGTAPRLERDMAELEVQRLDSRRHLAEGRAEAALVALKAAVGLEPGEVLAIRADLEAVVSVLVAGQPATTSTAPPRAPVERPDVAAAAERAAAALARVDAARAEGRPDLSVRGGYMRMVSGFPQLGLGPAGTPEPIMGRFNILVVGASIDLPIANRAQGMLAAALAEKRAADAERRAMQLDASGELSAAVALAAHARASLDVYAGRVRPLARRNLDVLRQAYELGSRSLMDVVNESRRYQDVEMGYTEALRAVYDAETAVRTARGAQ